MSDLNIRACKALGWEVKGERFVIPQSITFKNIEWNYWHQDFHFHDSYDWAMLGIRAVEALNDLQRGCELFEKFDNRLNSFMCATPEQITQAWVEVLEASK